MKKNIMGKAIYNEQKEKIGIVEDVIIAPDKSVSYLIIGAGGFVGIGRHDVAIPITQIMDQNGRLVMPGATKDMVKSMPRFDYATETAKRDQFIAFAEQDIAKAKTKIAELEKKAATANAETKQKLDQQIVAMKLDVASAEDKLAAMKKASAKKWKEFEVNVNAATARLQKWFETLVN
ncbi:PRC-barrel domain-containing protein [Undibacterium sp. Xuan67W]|uniref:PRC-barrel domain-containing protein n=1 Tax=Undibacterium sp. Xuan67W TaxID=3413057 RepID=UPI003BF453B2